MRSWRSSIGWLRTAPRSSEARREEATSDPTSERGWSLRSLLFLWLTIALLPIAVVSILQGFERARLDSATVRNRLVESARTAASDEENILASADQILRAVGNFSEVREIRPGCNRALVDALIGVRFFTNLTRMDASGRVVCSALPEVRGTSVAHEPIFEAVSRSRQFVVSDETFSTTLERPVIVAMRPVRDQRGKFLGAVSIVLDVHWLDYMLHARDLPSDSVVAVFDGTGKIMASNKPELAAPIFAHASTRASAQEALETGYDSGGNGWTFATAPLVGRTVYVGFAMREASLFGPTYLHAGTDFVMPIAMILLAWGGIWFATDRQVTQWIVYLRRVALAYRRGHYAVRPVLDSAPEEFRLLGDSLAEMASAIRDRDRRLREALEQKSVLIREIHHRVKNNLQIVMSLLSLQAGQLKDVAAREALMQAQIRINALALVHRILHEIEDQSTIDLKRLLEELTHQVTGGLSGEGSKLSVVTDIVSREVPGDLAVPLALFTVEALTNIFKHAYPAGNAPGRIDVKLRESGAGMLRLAIEDDGVGFRTDMAGKSVGSRLIKTFGQQVGGQSFVRSREGSGTVVELVFPDPAWRRSVEPDVAQAAR